MLKKSAIKSAKDIKTERVDCPEWKEDGQSDADAFLLVRGLSGADRDKYEASLIDAKRKGAKINLDNMRAKLIAYGTVNEDGSPYFAEADIAWLGDKSAAPLDRLYSKIQELSGMTPRDMEDLRKNLDTIPSDDSSSG